MLQILSKVCERVAYDRFASFSVIKKPSEQSADKRPLSATKNWHSAHTSVIHTADEIVSAIDKNKLSVVVFLDMSKAFDSIKHQIL